VNQNFVEYLKSKFKSTNFFQLKLNQKLFISFFDSGMVPPEFIKLIFKKFNCDVVLIVDLNKKTTLVVKREDSDVDISAFNNKVFGKAAGNSFKFTKEFLGLTKHFKPYANQ
jgi:hypothetical protein